MGLNKDSKDGVAAIMRAFLDIIKDDTWYLHLFCDESVVMDYPHLPQGQHPVSLPVDKNNVVDTTNLLAWAHGLGRFDS